MLLSYNDLCGVVSKNYIENVPNEYINAASIDVSLGEKILSENVMANKHTISLRARTPLQMSEHILTDDNYFLLMPGQFILAHTEQIFNLPSWLSCEFKLKSSVARIGIQHALAGWCDAGWNGSVLTLELHNTTKHHAIKLHKRDRIGQMVFFAHKQVPKERDYSTRGRYNNNKSVHGIKV